MRQVRFVLHTETRSNTLETNTFTSLLSSSLVHNLWFRTSTHLLFILTFWGPSHHLSFSFNQRGSVGTGDTVISSIEWKSKLISGTLIPYTDHSFRSALRFSTVTCSVLLFVFTKDVESYRHVHRKILSECDSCLFVYLGWVLTDCSVTGLDL